MRYRPTTLRARLLLGGSIVTAIILLAAGLLIYVFLRASLLAEFDQALGSSLEAVAALTEQDNEGVRMEPEAATIPEFARKKTPDYFAVWVEPGQLVASSPSLGGRPLPHPVPAKGASAIESVVLPDGLPGRQSTMTFVPVLEDSSGHSSRGTRTVTVTVARHIQPIEQKLAHLALLLLGIGAAATLGAAGAMLLVVRSGLRPLQQLAARIDSMGDDNLGERVKLPDAPAELTVVAQRLNELLDRLQSTVVRERRFTADAAHELRTPLAGLETILDVCATRPRPAEDYARTLVKCHQIVRGMHAMVDSLMTLARADTQQLGVTLSRVPLAVVLQDCWTSYSQAAAAKSLQPAFEMDSRLTIDTDTEKLRMIVNNLLDNAVSHADAGGWLRVEGRVAGNNIEITFSNSGSALNEVQAARAFDRFWRGDAARRNTGVHCGLGLSLCRELVAILSGEIVATSEPGGVFLVRVILPRSPAGSSPATADSEDAPSAGTDSARTQSLKRAAAQRSSMR
jgi:two-component system heavy metal sensor histidine kinase CusS